MYIKFIVFKFLTDFVKHFKECKISVQAREGFDDKQRLKTMLSQEATSGIEITGSYNEKLMSMCCY